MSWVAPLPVEDGLPELPAPPPPVGAGVVGGTMWKPGPWEGPVACVLSTGRPVRPVPTVTTAATTERAAAATANEAMVRLRARPVAAAALAATTGTAAAATSGRGCPKVRG